MIFLLPIAPYPGDRFVLRRPELGRAANGGFCHEVSCDVQSIHRVREPGISLFSSF
jgi:hypothetical protein